MFQFSCRFAFLSTYLWRGWRPLVSVTDIMFTV